MGRWSIPGAPSSAKQPLRADPRSADTPSDVTLSTRSSKSSAARRIIHVLVVEPDAETGRTIHHSLAQATDFQSHAARDLEEASALLGLRSFDAAIIAGDGDAGPGDFVEQLRGSRPEIAVLILGDDPGGLCAADVADPQRLAAAIIAAFREAGSSRRHETMVRWLERESQVDALTGLHNRLAFEDRFDQLCATLAEAAAPITLILMDVVGTRMVNDAHGRDAGDRMIRRAATGILRSVRGADFAARIDGDDFAVIVPNADLELGRRIARRITHEIERLNGSEWQAELPVEVTFGVASGTGCRSGELFAAAHFELVNCRSRTAVVTQFPDLEAPDGPSVA